MHRVSFGLLRDDDRQRWKQQIIAAAGGDTTAADDFYIAKSRWSLAVPFIGKDVPSRAAEFAHPDVLLGLSILAFRYNGLRSSDVKLVIQNLKMTMLNEPGPFSERSTRMPVVAPGACARAILWAVQAAGTDSLPFCLRLC